MNWIALSAIAFVSQIGYGLSIKYSNKMNLSTRTLNFVMFLATAVVCLAVAVISGDTLIISGTPLVVTILAGVVFSFLGNLTLMKSASLAPNAGYTFSITNCNALVGTFGSLLLFDDRVSKQKIFGIALIIAFSTLVVIERTKSKRQENKVWILYAIATVFSFGGLSLSSRYVFNSGTSASTFLVYVLLIVCAMIAVETKLTKRSLRFSRVQLPLLFWASMASIVLNLSLFGAFKVAPNVGYVQAIVASSASALTLLSIWLFKAHFSIRKFVGVIGVIAGLTVMFI